MSDPMGELTLTDSHVFDSWLVPKSQPSRAIPSGTTTRPHLPCHISSRGPSQAAFNA